MERAKAVGGVVALRHVVSGLPKTPHSAEIHRLGADELRHVVGGRAELRVGSG